MKEGDVTPEQEAVLRDMQIQLRELRTEIGDLETTVAELAARQPSPAGLPWPLSALAALLHDPAAVIGDQIGRWEALLEEFRNKPAEMPQFTARALEAKSSDAESK